MKAEFEAIYNREFQGIYSYLKFATGNGDIAKEITQDVFVVFWQFLSDKAAVPVNTAGWLRTVAYNKLKEFYRRKYNRQNLRMDLPKNTQDASSTVIADETENEITKALLSLDQKQQLAVFYLDIQKLSYKEAVEVLNIPERSLRRLREKAWSKLNEKFRKLNFAPQIQYRRGTAVQPVKRTTGENQN